MDPKKPPAPAADGDVALMLAFQQGREDAFEELVRRHRKAVLNLVYRYLGDPGSAEDVAQDVFLKVYRARASYQPAAKFTTWLYRITVNHCLNEIRGRKSRNPLPMEDVLEESSAVMPDDGMRQAEVREAVRHAIDSLPDNQRIAVVLSRFHEQSYDEIAEAMGVSLEAVKSLLFRARENLKEKLKSFVRPG